MTTKQENKFSMYLVNRDYVESQSDIAAAIPGFSTLNTLYKGYIQGIQANRDVQEGDKSGVTLNKTQLKELLIEESLDLSDKLVAFAALTENIALETEVSFNDSDLRKSADTILKDKAQLLYNRATKYLAQLGDYDIDAGSLASYLDLINKYEAAIPQPKLTKNEAKTATENIDDLMTKADNALVKMDKLVAASKKKYPEFYVGYTKSRIVTNSGSGSLALKGLVKDVDGQAVANVKVDITVAADLAKGAASNKVLFTKRSTAKGQFQQKNLVDGQYVAILSKNEYKTALVSFSITGGELTKLDVVLEKETV